jgi:hypothetical protein
MKPEYLLIVLIYLGFAAAEALHGGFFRRPNQTRADAIVETVSTLVLFGWPLLRREAGRGCRSSCRSPCCSSATT